MEFGLLRSLGPSLHFMHELIVALACRSADPVEGRTDIALQGPYMCQATIGIGLFSECHFNTDAHLKPVMGFDFFVAGGA